MLSSTTDAIRSILKTDPGLTPADRNQIITAIRNHGRKPEKETPRPEPSRILRRREVAKLFSVTTRTIDNWAKAGLIHRKKLPGRLKSFGYDSAEIHALISD